MQEIWLDTDPGFDDWMAWALLEADPGIELLGVSVVAGNAPLPAVLANALRIKALHGFAVPVHAGCDRPLVQPQTTAENVLGAGAMASSGRVLPHSPAALTPGHGVQALIDAVRARPGRVTLLAIGPLTNVATAFALAPELPQLLKAPLVIMGGSTDTGNTNAVAEFNIHADPEAASAVFNAGIEIVMFGINVCRQVQIGPAELAAMRALAGEPAAIFADHLDAYIGHSHRRGGSTMALYDPSPVIWLARPELFELVPARVDIELDGRYTRGMTVCEFRLPQHGPPNARVAMAAQGGPALAFAVERLTRLFAGV